MIRMGSYIRKGLGGCGVASRECSLARYNWATISQDSCEESSDMGEM